MSETEKKDNAIVRALKSAYKAPPNAVSGRAYGDPAGRVQASYKPPLESQIGQIDRGEAWWRDFAWEEYATKDLPGLGLGFTVYPYVAVWEKIWGAVPTEDYEKYKQYYVQEPFIRATIDFHTQMTISQGYELDYPLDTVVNDVKKFLDRHDFLNLLKIMVKDMLVFGNSYTEIVRTWFCHETGHDLAALRISYETTSKDGDTKYWWTDRVDVAQKHNEMYPTHKLENPYGEIVRFKPLDPMYMRVRRDAYGTILGYVQYYVFPLVTFLADEIIHLRYMPTSWTYESVYGVSMLRPILFHQELMKNYEQTMGAIMNIFLKPMFLVKVGGEGGPLGGEEVTSQQYQQVKRFFQQSQPGQSLVIRAASPVKVDPIDPPIDRMQTTAFWLQWLHNMRTYALSVPKFFCYAEDTKVLTREGWKYHYEVRPNEEIMVYDNMTGKTFYEANRGLHEFNFDSEVDGKMLSFQHKGIDLLVTPDHTMLYRTAKHLEYRVSKAKELLDLQNVYLPNTANYIGASQEFEIIPSVKYKTRPAYEAIKVNMDSWLKLIGLYLSEGGIGEKDFSLNISQKEGTKANIIRASLSNLPFKVTEGHNERIVWWSISGKQICSHIANLCGKHSYDKHIPVKYKNLAQPQLLTLLESLLLGDGSINDDGTYDYYTVSDQLAEDVAEIGFKLGMTVSIRKRAVETLHGKNKRPLFVVRLGRITTDIGVSRDNIKEVDYKGRVFCFSTSTGFYPTMRNGHIIMAGNTDPAGLNRATAQTVERGYFTFINSNRQSLNSQLEESILQMVMRSLYGKIADELIKEYGVPKFIWKPVKEDSLEDKAKTYLPLYASRILTKNEVRTALGFKPLDEEELQEELGETLPPLGGSPGVGAPGVTREGTPTFGSPDERMASRPPTGMGGGGGGGGEEGTPEGGEGFFGKSEEEETMEDLQEEVDSLKRMFQQKVEEEEMKPEPRVIRREIHEH